MGIGFPKLRQWLADEPGLAFFAFYLDQLELRQAHVRSGEVEEVLALANDPFSAASSIYNSLNNADLTFKPAVAADGSTLEVGQASIGELVTHPDRAVRRSAWENYADGYLEFKNTMASTLVATLKQDVFNARVRGYQSCLHASLAPGNIPVEVFHNLIDVFKKNLPTWHRYWRLRRSACWATTNCTCMTSKRRITQNKPVVPFSQAVDWICEGMAPLGEDYVSILRQRLPARSLGGLGPQQGQARGRFLQRLHGHPPLHHDELCRRCVQPEHAGPRAGALAALLPQPPVPAVHLQRATRSSWPRWRPTSTRRWCAITCSARRPTRPSRSP